MTVYLEKNTRNTHDVPLVLVDIEDEDEDARFEGSIDTVFIRFSSKGQIAQHIKDCMALLTSKEDRAVGATNMRIRRF